jgi:hypothetical protein
VPLALNSTRDTKVPLDLRLSTGTGCSSDSAMRYPEEFEILRVAREFSIPSYSEAIPN